MGSEVKLPSIPDFAATASVRLYFEPPAVSRTDHAMQKLIWITEIKNSFKGSHRQGYQ